MFSRFLDGCAFVLVFHIEKMYDRKSTYCKISNSKYCNDTACGDFSFLYHKILDLFSMSMTDVETLILCVKILILSTLILCILNLTICVLLALEQRSIIRVGAKC